MLVDLPIFYEDTHSYIGQYGPMKDKKYTSVTTLIHKFEKPKDWEAIAAGYARKVGHGDAKYWMNQWKIRNKESCEFGSGYHLAREMSFSIMAESGLPVYTNMMCPKKGYKKATPFWELPDGIHSEVLLWNEFYRVSGQSDMCTIKGRRLRINDFKTNKEIKMEGFKGETLTGPLSHIPNANYWIYALQLSTYAYLMELVGYEVEHLTIEHVTDNSKIYLLPYMRNEVIAMLDYHKNGTITK